MADVLDVIADHLGSEDRALRLLAALERAGLEVTARPTERDVLEATERDVTGEPFCGPRQGELIHALTCRLHQGIPLGHADLAAAQWLAHALGLPEGELGKVWTVGRR